MILLRHESKRRAMFELSHDNTSEQIQIAGANEGATMQTLRVRDSEKEGGHGGEVFSCVYSNDGAYVLSAGWDGYLRLWLSASAQLVSFLHAAVKPLSACAFVPDGSAWVSGSMDGVLDWWDAVSHQRRLQLIP